MEEMAPDGGFMGKRLMAVAGVITVLVLASACGGGGSDEDEPSVDRTPGANDAPPTQASNEPEPTSDSDDDDSETTPGGGNRGDVSVSAEPGQAVVEVEGETIMYDSAGSIAYTCDIDSERIQVNFQTPEGHDLLIQGGALDGELRANITFTVGGDGPNLNHSASTPNDGELQIGDDALRYEGTVTIVDDFDIETSRDVDAVIEVNCATAGGDPRAEIDGQTFVFEISGAQSFDCEITDANTFRVQVNRLSLDDLQLSFDGRPEGDGVIGNVTITAGDDSYTATLFGAQPEGLVVEGSTITYTGTFEHRVNGEVEGDVEGTATAACP
jgi:hypothetical protein